MLKSLQRGVLTLLALLSLALSDTHSLPTAPHTISRQMLGQTASPTRIQTRGCLIVPPSPILAKFIQDGSNLEPLRGGMGSTVSQSVFTLAAFLMGGMILSLPYGFRCAGMGLGALILAVVAAMNGYTSWLLLKMAIVSKCDSYEELCSRICEYS